MRTIWPVLAVAATGASAGATLPADLRQAIEKLPGRTLTIDLVLQVAMKSSDSFRAVQSQRIALDAPELASRAPLDPRVEASLSTSDERPEQLSPFAASQTKTAGARAGIKKQFATGSALAWELGYGKTSLDYDSPNPLLADIDAHSARMQVSASQSLWRNAFGASTRATLAAGKARGAALHENLRKSTEEWARGLIRVYVSAWLAQARSRAAEASLERRERLVTITQTKLRRGNAEKPDLLQVQSARNLAETQREAARAELEETWKALVTALKLPESWLAADPAEIPLALDDSPDAERARCEGGAGPAEDEAARLEAEAASESARQAAWDAKPDLKLQASLASNGIDSSKVGESLKEAALFKHKSWSLALAFEMPLGFDGEKAALHSRAADAIRAEAARDSSRDQIRVEWRNACAALARLERSRRLIAASHEAQTERTRLEDERFRIGRAPTIAVIQAGDDATQAELALAANDAERRLVAWGIRQKAGKLADWLEALAAKAPPKGLD